MIKELSWYLESGRFVGIVEELEDSLRKYETAKKENAPEETRGELREKARLLFEDHCVRSGMREEDNSFINIDAEFFTGDTIDEPAMNDFIKHILKNHCYQKVLWTFMGTTGSFTQISKSAMEEQGLKYEDYLPIEYKKKLKVKKPFEHLLDGNTELFYMYGDGTISKEYIKEKAKLRFDRLQDESGIDWKKGYDPNGSVVKKGWHGAFDETGTWVQVKDEDQEKAIEQIKKEYIIEIIKNKDSAILYDPGRLLITPVMLAYTTVRGEPYGNLETDIEKTVNVIKETLDKIGAKDIEAICGIDEPEVLEMYKKTLKSLVSQDLKLIDKKAMVKIKEECKNEALEKTNEKTGVQLSRKIDIALTGSEANEGVYEIVSNGNIIVPLSPRKKEDAASLGLTEEDTKNINGISVKKDKSRMFDTILSNLYAAWAVYGYSFKNKTEAAVSVNRYLENEKDELTLITAQTGLKDILKGNIPGKFTKPKTVDFYDRAQREEYIEKLEKEGILPSGAKTAALSALESLPEGTIEQKETINLGLTCAFSQYKEISMSSGMPIAELIEAVKEPLKYGGKKIYYEIPVEALMEEAAKENLQKKVIPIINMMDKSAKDIVVGGVSGHALNEVEFTRSKLVNDYGISDKEAVKAQDFLHNVRLTGANAAIPHFLYEAVKQSRGKTAKELRGNVLNAINVNRAASYNLSSAEGLRAYVDSNSACGRVITASDIERLLREEPRVKQEEFITRIEPKYRAKGEVVPLTRDVPRGLPEKIQLAGSRLIESEKAPVTEPVLLTRKEVAPKAETKEIKEEKQSNYFPKQNYHDTELERLKRIEANYEKDKAMLARQKQPVLARSVSHDIGHAGGDGVVETSDNKKVSKRLYKQFTSDLKKEI